VRSPRKLAKFRRDYLAQASMLAEDERIQEAAEINKALGIEAPKGSATATTLATARAAYVELLGSLASNVEVKAEVARFREQLDQTQLQMLGPKPRKRQSKIETADRSSAR
jgi:ribonuclease HIII